EIAVMASHVTRAMWSEYETYGRKFELDVSLAFAIKDWVYFMHTDKSRQLLHRFHIHNYTLTKVLMEFHDTFVPNIDKDSRLDPIVYQNAVYLWSSVGMCRGAFELDGVFHWRSVNTDGETPSPSSIDSFMASVVDSGRKTGGQPVFRQVVVIDEKIVLYELDMEKFEWTNRYATMPEEIVEAIKSSKTRTHLTLIGRKWHVQIEDDSESAAAKHLVLDIDTNRWEEVIAKQNSSLSSIGQHNIFASDSCLLLHGIDKVTDKHVLHQYTENSEEWTEVPVNYSPAMEKVSPSYWNVVTVGSRHFFIGGRDIRREFSHVTLLAVLETEMRDENSLSADTLGGQLIRDRNYDAVIPDLIDPKSTSESSEMSYDEDSDCEHEPRMKKKKATNEDDDEEKEDELFQYRDSKERDEVEDMLRMMHQTVLLKCECESFRDDIKQLKAAVASLKGGDVKEEEEEEEVDDEDEEESVDERDEDDSEDGSED
ncbi:hypothetical protein PENTCL1PPCAC_8592, partial [Pristionchus entomophagus]